MDNYKTACVFGGTGFIGRQVVRDLAARGIRIKVATRVPVSAYFLRTSGAVGQIVPVLCDYKDPQSVQSAIAGCDYVVNCVGILYERKKGGFERVHGALPGVIAAACAQEKVERFVHVSALGIESSNSLYAQSKYNGEKAVKSAFPLASILRPSVVFGEDDAFFNKFAKLAAVLPFLPLIGGGKTRFQPVYVGDVASSVMACLFLPAVGAQNPQGKTYELGGPEIVTFRQIYEIMFSYTHHKKPLLSISWGLAKLQAALMGMLPAPLLTADQVESLKSDTIVTKDALTLADLDIAPKAMAVILPHYLSRYQPGGRFAQIRNAS